MSVTFSCPDAPTTSTPCEWCEDTRRWHAEGLCCHMWPHLDGVTIRDEAQIAAFTPDEMARLTCSPHCNGTQDTSLAPEANFANASARGVLALMGQDASDLWGLLEPAEIPAVMQRLMVALNRDDAREGLVSEGSDGRAFDKARMVTDPDTGLSTISRGCRVLDGGNTDEQTLRRLGAVRDLLSYAHEHGHTVSWG